MDLCLCPRKKCASYPSLKDRCALLLLFFLEVMEFCLIPDDKSTLSFSWVKAFTVCWREIRKMHDFGPMLQYLLTTSCMLCHWENPLQFPVLPSVLPMSTQWDPLEKSFQFSMKSHCVCDS